jgi:hypothetical protein
MSMSADSHPPLFELEALHVGEGDALTARHAETCATCRAYLAELARDAARFAAERDPDAFARAVAVRARAPGPRRGWWAAGRSLTFAAAAAAAVVSVVWIGSGHPPAARDVIQTRGGIQVAGVLLHGDRQARQAGEISGAPGDRFRVEIALAAPAALDAMVIDDSGRIVVLAEGRPFASGTHYLEPALTFDDSPTVARLLVGPAGSVRRALAGATDPRVVVLRVRSQGR